MTFPRGLVDRYKQEYNFVYYPPNSCLFRSLKFLFFFCWRDNSLSRLRFFLTFRRKFSPTKSSANFTVSIDFSISVHGILFCLIYVLLSDSQVISVKQSYIPWIELTGLYIHWCEAFVPFPPACNQTFEVKLSNLSFKNVRFIRTCNETKIPY